MNTIILYHCKPFNASLSPMGCKTQRTRSVGTIDYGKGQMDKQCFMQARTCLECKGLSYKVATIDTESLIKSHAKAIAEQMLEFTEEQDVFIEEEAMSYA